MFRFGSERYTPWAVPIDTARASTPVSLDEAGHLVGLGEHRLAADRGLQVRAADVPQLGLDAHAVRRRRSRRPPASAARSPSNCRAEPSIITEREAAVDGRADQFQVVGVVQVQHDRHRVMAGHRADQARHVGHAVAFQVRLQAPS